MDLISVVSDAIGLLRLFVRLIVSFKLKEGSFISRTYGTTLGWIITIFFGKTATEYERISRVVLRGTDEEALRFRGAVTSECNMTAVAGAIITQVALTALSLPSLSLAHWTARAFLLFATVAGCISVYRACSLSRDIGKCYQPEAVRDWLTAANTSNIASFEVDKNEGRNASLSGIFVLSAPYTMMSYSILAFITGLAIYQGFVWTRTLDTDAGKTNSRNVFIAYIASSGFCQLFFASAGIIKAFESRLIHRSSMRKLRKWAQGSGGIVERSPRDGDEPLHLEQLNQAAFASHAAASTQEDIAASQHQVPKVESPYRGLEVALETAARAHILSAEADRQVASEYAKLSRLQEGPGVVE